MYCQECGTKRLNSDNFCKECGLSFKKNNKNNSSKKFIIIFFSIIAIIIYFGIFALPFFVAFKAEVSNNEISTVNLMCRDNSAEFELIIPNGFNYYIKSDNTLKIYNEKTAINISIHKGYYDSIKNNKDILRKNLEEAQYQVKYIDVFTLNGVEFVVWEMSWGEIKYLEAVSNIDSNYYSLVFFVCDNGVCNYDTFYNISNIVSSIKYKGEINNIL